MIHTNYGPDICQILEEQDTGLGQQANLVSGILTEQTLLPRLLICRLPLTFAVTLSRFPAPPRWERSPQPGVWGGEGQHLRTENPATLGPYGSSRVSAALETSSAGQPIRSRVCGDSRRADPPRPPAPGRPGHQLFKGAPAPRRRGPRACSVQLGSSMATHIVLSNGAKMPLVGLGTWKVGAEGAGPACGSFGLRAARRGDLG